MTTDATPKPADGFLVVTPDTTVAELEEALTHLANRASRLPYFFPEYAKLHDRMNALLTYRDALLAFPQVLPRA